MGVLLHGCVYRSTSLTRNCPPVVGGWEAGSYLRLIDSCITQLKAQGPSRTCNESKEEEEEVQGVGCGVQGICAGADDLDVHLVEQPPNLLLGVGIWGVGRGVWGSGCGIWTG